MKMSSCRNDHDERLADLGGKSHTKSDIDNLAEKAQCTIISPGHGPVGLTLTVTLSK